MNREWEIDPGLGGEERQALSRLADRLEHERPLPSPAFRGKLRRQVIVPRRSATRARRYRALAASYAGLGLFCLVVAAAGLTGTGPFAA